MEYNHDYDIIIPRRFEVTDNTIIDLETSLEWDRDFNRRGVQGWESAMKIDESGFKVPSTDEFISLYLDNSRTPTRIELEKIGFVGPTFFSWTNEYDKRFGARATNFGKGNFYYENINNQLQTICVRKI